MRNDARKYLTIIIFSLCRLLVCAQPLAAQQKPIRDIIDEKNLEFAAAVKRGDAAAVARFHTEDAMLLPTNQDIISGTDNIKIFFQRQFDAGVKSETFTILEAVRFGATAYEMSRYVIFGAGEKELDKGKFIIIWKRTGSEWKIYRAIFNSDNPLPKR